MGHRITTRATSQQQGSDGATPATKGLLIRALQTGLARTRSTLAAEFIPRWFKPKRQAGAPIQGGIGLAAMKLPLAAAIFLLTAKFDPPPKLLLLSAYYFATDFLYDAVDIGFLSDREGSRPAGTLAADVLGYPVHMAIRWLRSLAHGRTSRQPG